MLKIQDFLCEWVPCSVELLVRGFISANLWHCSKNLLRNLFSEQNLFRKHKQMYRNSNILPPNMLKNQGKAAFTLLRTSCEWPQGELNGYRKCCGRVLALPWPRVLSQQSQSEVGPGWEMALECVLQTYPAINLLYFLTTQLPFTPSSFRATSWSPTPIFTRLSSLLRVPPFQSWWHMIHQLSSCSLDQQTGSWSSANKQPARARRGCLNACRNNIGNLIYSFQSLLRITSQN